MDLVILKVFSNAVDSDLTSGPLQRAHPARVSQPCGAGLLTAHGEQRGLDVFTARLCRSPNFMFPWCSVWCGGIIIIIIILLS